MELAQAVMWSSSNEDAVIVDDNGVVRIVGEGVAAITATADTYSSAIAIEGVKSADSVSDMGFPSLDAMNAQKVNNTDNKTQTQNGSEQGGDSSETVTHLQTAIMAVITVIIMTPVIIITAAVRIRMLLRQLNLTVRHRTLPRRRQQCMKFRLQSRLHQSTRMRCLRFSREAVLHSIFPMLQSTRLMTTTTVR